MCLEKYILGIMIWVDSKILILTPPIVQDFMGAKGPRFQPLVSTNLSWGDISDGPERLDQGSVAERVTMPLKCCYSEGREHLASDSSSTLGLARAMGESWFGHSLWPC